MIRKNFLFTYWLLVAYILYSIVIALVYYGFDFSSHKEATILYGASDLGAPWLVLLLMEFLFLWLVFFKEGDEDLIFHSDSSSYPIYIWWNSFNSPYITYTAALLSAIRILSVVLELDYNDGLFWFGMYVSGSFSLYFVFGKSVLRWNETIPEKVPEDKELILKNNAYQNLLISSKKEYQASLDGSLLPYVFLSYLGLKRVSQAKEYFKKYLTDFSDVVGHESRYIEAIVRLNKELEHSSDRIKIYASLIWFYLNSGLLSKAEETFIKLAEELMSVNEEERNRVLHFFFDELQFKKV